MQKYRLTKLGDPIIRWWNDKKKTFTDHKRIHHLTPAQESTIKEIEYLSARINQLMEDKTHLKQAGEDVFARMDLKKYIRAIRKASIRLEEDMILSNWKKIN